MITLYGRRNSVNVQKVMWTLAEADCEYSRIDVGGSFGGTNTSSYRYLNPNGVVPTLQDESVVVWESNAIVRYLSQKYPRARLVPNSQAASAIADQWMDWTSTTLWPEWLHVFKSTVRTPEEQRSDANIASAATRLGELYGRLDAWLARNRYVAGDDFSMGDIPVGSTCYRYFEMQIPRPNLPNLVKWYSQLCDRLSFRANVMIPFGTNPTEWLALEQHGTSRCTYSAPVPCGPRRYLRREHQACGDPDQPVGMGWGSSVGCAALSIQAMIALCR